MKKILFATLAILSVLACQRDTPQEQTEKSLDVISDENPAWVYENLRLYPIVAAESFLQANAAAAQVKTLAEAIQTYGFRISEKKPFGRFDDMGAVNNLTVQNKTEDPVLLMGGEIVQGGRQDRVIGEDQVIAARSIRDIPVFCVEQGRWNYREAGGMDENTDEQRKKIYAFSGYYHVAASGIRQTLRESRSQHEVWQKVSEVTAKHNAESGTSAYAGLEGSEEYTRERDEYLRFFTGKFDDLPNLVGIMAVSGSRIIGADVFGHPDLCKRQLPALLHSYITEAMTRGERAGASAEIIPEKLETINRTLNGKNPSPNRCSYQGALVHFSDI